MATSTYKSFLMRKVSTDWVKVCDIKNYPDLIQPPEMLETTTLSDGARTYIPGIQNNDSLAFTTNYDSTVYATLVTYASADESTDGEYAVWFGATVSGGVATPTGSEGKFEFDGIMANPTIVGKGVNEVREMTVTIAPTSPIALAS
jgi:hypothetical protein